MNLLRFLAFMTRDYRLWHVREFRRVRDSFLFALAALLVFIIPGVALGAWNWSLKASWLVVGSIVTFLVLFRLSRDRLLIGWEAGFVARGGAVNAARVGRSTLRVLGRGVTPFTWRRLGVAMDQLGDAAKGLANSAAQGFESYAAFVAAVLASELGVMLITVWFPAHRWPAASALLIPVVLVLSAHSLWTSTKLHWPRFVEKLGYFTIAMVFIMVLAPVPFRGIVAVADRAQLATGCAIDSAQPECVALRLEKLRSALPSETNSLQEWAANRPLCSEAKNDDPYAEPLERSQIFARFGCWSGYKIRTAPEGNAVAIDSKGDVFIWYQGNRWPILDGPTRFTRTQPMREAVFRVMAATSDNTEVDTFATARTKAF